MGQPGSPGARGPSDGYYANETGSVDLNTPDAGPHTIAQLPLPAGDYIVTATATIRNYDTTHTVYFTSCDLAGATPLTNASSDVSAPPGSVAVGGKSAASLTSAVHLTTATTLVLQCTGDLDSSELDAADGNMTAIQVGQLHPAP